MITLDDLQKCEIRIGKVLSAERIEGSDKLVKFFFDFGAEGTRQVLGGFGKAYPDPSVLVGKLVPVVWNLEPRSLMGLESQGMILAASDADGRPAILTPDRDVPPGTLLK